MKSGPEQSGLARDTTHDVDLYVNMDQLFYSPVGAIFSGAYVFLKSVRLPPAIPSSGPSKVLVETYQNDLPPAFIVGAERIVNIPFSLDQSLLGHVYRKGDRVLAHENGVLWRAVVLRCDGRRAKVKWMANYQGYGAVSNVLVEDIIPIGCISRVHPRDLQYAARVTNAKARYEECRENLELLADAALSTES